MNLREFLSHVHIHFNTPDDGLVTFPALDPPRPHEEHWSKGDIRSEPANLAYPHDIVQLRYEDMKIADNFRDLEISANPITHQGQPHFVAVFFAEGSVEKWVCYDTKLIHHYEPQAPEYLDHHKMIVESRRNHYGIFATYDLPLKGPCPFLFVPWR